MRKSARWWMAGWSLVAVLFFIVACGESPQPSTPPAPGKARPMPMPPKGAEKEKTAPMERMEMPGTQPAAPAEGKTDTKEQTMCPVSGDKIDKSFFVDYKGKRVYFCCAMCPPKFNEDPDKYIKMMEDKGIVLEKAPAANP